MKILVKDEQIPQAREQRPEWAILQVTGALLAIVGWSDLAFLWFPLQFGNVEWEFATIGAHLNGMPLGTVGFGLLAASFSRAGTSRAIRILASLLIVIALWHVLIGVVFLLDVPVALKGSAPLIRPILQKTMLKAGLFSVAYIAFYAALGTYLWSKTRFADGRPASSE